MPSKVQIYVQLAEEYWEVHNGEIFDIIERSVLQNGKKRRQFHFTH